MLPSCWRAGHVMRRKGKAEIGKSRQLAWVSRLRRPSSVGAHPRAEGEWPRRMKDVRSRPTRANPSPPSCAPACGPVGPGEALLFDSGGALSAVTIESRIRRPPRGGVVAGLLSNKISRLRVTPSSSRTSRPGLGHRPEHDVFLVSPAGTRWGCGWTLSLPSGSRCGPCSKT